MGTNDEVMNSESSDKLLRPLNSPDGRDVIELSLRYLGEDKKQKQEIMGEVKQNEVGFDIQ